MVPIRIKSGNLSIDRIRIFAWALRVIFYQFLFPSRKLNFVKLKENNQIPWHCCNFFEYFLTFILINKYYFFFRYNGHILFMETPRLWWWVLAFCALKSNTLRAIYQTSKCNIHGLIKQKCQKWPGLFVASINSFKCSNLFPFRTNWLLFAFKVIMRRRRQINLLFVYLLFIFL